MKCPECDGYKNFVSLAGTPFEVVRPCKRCNGTGEIQQTGEEWLRRATTYELVNFLCAVQNVYHFNPDEWELWLKQPHRGVKK